MKKWNIDADHSCAAFSVRYMKVSNIRGMFNKISGTIQFDPSDPSRISVEVEIDVSSIDTGIKKRDEHLRSSDFFDASKYPKIIFKSTKSEVKKGNRCRITGDLTIHGFTRPVTLEGEYGGPVKGPYGEEITIGFSGSTRINREDFGIMWGGEPMDGGGLLLSKDVDITLDVQADLVNE